MKKLVIMAAVGMVLLAPYATAHEKYEYIAIPIPRFSGGGGTVLEYASKAMYINTTGDSLDFLDLGIYGFMDLRWLELSTGLFLGPSYINQDAGLGPFAVITPSLLFKFPVFPKWPHTSVSKGDLIRYPIMFGAGINLPIMEPNAPFFGFGVPSMLIKVQLGTGVDRIIGSRSYLRFQVLGDVHFQNAGPVGFGATVKLGVGFAGRDFQNYRYVKYLP